MTSGDYWSSDWRDACDPVPARRELTPGQAAKRARYWANERKRGWGKPGADAPSAYRVEPDFDEMEG